MATALKNLSSFNAAELKGAQGFRFGVVCADWNPEVTHSLLDGCVTTLKSAGVKAKNITVTNVPGSFELVHGAKLLADKKKFDVIIAIGCIIQGETRHFDFISSAVAFGLTELNTQYNIPFIFGVLTTNNLKQAKDRSGGKHGNKGVEAAVTAVKMAMLRKKKEAGRKKQEVRGKKKEIRSRK